MRLFFFGPRVFGIRPGISLGREDFARRRRSKASPVTGSFVYVIEGDHNMTKIGVSTNPNARLAQLKTGSAFPVRFAFVGATPGTGFDIERAAHTMLSRHRCAGEWFDVPPAMAIAAVHGAAHSVGQKLQPVEPEWIERIIQMAAVGEPDEHDAKMDRRWGLLAGFPWPLRLAAVAILYGVCAIGGAAVATIVWAISTSH